MANNAPKSIDTFYNGYKFRSRTEARWAIFFDELNIAYDYEPQGFELGDVRYLPDFHLTNGLIFHQFEPTQPDQVWVEIKPAGELSESERVKIAGFVRQTDGHILLISGQPDINASLRFIDYHPETNWLITDVRWIELQDGQIGLVPVNLLNNGDLLNQTNTPRLRHALDKARQARFEFGQTPAPPQGSHNRPSNGLSTKVCKQCGQEFKPYRPHFAYCFECYKQQKQPETPVPASVGQAAQKQTPLQTVKPVATQVQTAPTRVVQQDAQSEANPIQSVGPAASQTKRTIQLVVAALAVIVLAGFVYLNYLAPSRHVAAPQTADTIAAVPQAVDTAVAVPQAVDTIATVPQAADTAVAVPQAVDTVVPEATTSDFRAIGSLDPAIPEEASIRGEIVTAAGFSHGYRFTLDDGSGHITLLMWHSVYDDCWDAPELNIGATVTVSGTTSLFEDDFQIQPRFGSQVKVESAGDFTAASPDISDLAQYMGEIVSITGTVEEIDSGSAGVRFLVSNESGAVPVFIWHSNLERIPDKEALNEPGSLIQVQGIVQEFRSNLEIVPTLPYDVVIVP